MERLQKKDPVKYKGSGLHWQRHLKVHGNDVTTIWYQQFTDENAIVEYATNFSIANNIIESTEWSNLKNENGLDGGSKKGRVFSDITRQRLSNAGKNRKHSIDTKNKISQAKIGKSRQQFSEEWKSNLSKNHRSKHGYKQVVSKETKRKIAKSLSKPVYCITNSTWYKTRAEAAEILGLKVGNIGHCVNGYQKSTGGYVFAVV